MKAAPPTPTVCVVIPCYRATLKPYESLALQQCRRVLGSHDTFFVKPRSLDISGLASRSGITKIESFDDKFFDGVAGYNQLMLSDEFYARFANYDYLLIHQLDAFVFRDELLAWCQSGHDYIGAPWLPAMPAPSRLEEVRIRLRQYWYRWTNKMDPATQGTHKAQYMYAVGNGGFSLRRVSKMRSILGSMPFAVDQYCKIDGKTHYEDIFFSIEANRYFPRVKLPSFRQAVGFAWELQPSVARELNKGRLPFGCHGWNKLHLNEWRPIFSELGYSLDELVR